MNSWTECKITTCQKVPDTKTLASWSPGLTYAELLDRFSQPSEYVDAALTKVQSICRKGQGFDAVVESLDCDLDAARDTDEAALILSAYSRALADKAVLSEMLTNACSDEETLQNIGSTSIQHVLGFDRLVLARHKGYTIRLHIWWPCKDKERVARENPHSHKWSFASSMIFGEFRVQLLKPVATDDCNAMIRPGDEEQLTLFTAMSDRSKNICALEFKAHKDSLRVVEDVIQKEGQTYVLPHTMIHRILVDYKGDYPGAMTLMIALPPVGLELSSYEHMNLYTCMYMYIQVYVYPLCICGSICRCTQIESNRLSISTLVPLAPVFNAGQEAQ